eukprot:2593560-Rhodomonas_salina.1
MPCPVAMQRAVLTAGMVLCGKQHRRMRSVAIDLLLLDFDAPPGIALRLPTKCLVCATNTSGGLPLAGRGGCRGPSPLLLPLRPLP